ncbi:MAG: hypothetical protein EON57_11910 [Alphaproteobacteria bacterium]|nr:MAG: hypothetical protein EON57_11910 [Alphaproteobacteria bacterium]
MRGDGASVRAMASAQSAGTASASTRLLPRNGMTARRAEKALASGSDPVLAQWRARSGFMKWRIRQEMKGFVKERPLLAGLKVE